MEAGRGVGHRQKWQGTAQESTPGNQRDETHPMDRDRPGQAGLRP